MEPTDSNNTTKKEVNPVSYLLLCESWDVPDPAKAGNYFKCYRCPKEECKFKTTPKSANAKKIQDKDGRYRNPDGRYTFTHTERGFTNIRTHLQGCIGVKESLELVEAALQLKKEKESGKTQRRLTDMSVMKHLKARSPREKIILEFVTMVADKNQPLTNVDDTYWRSLVYGRHGYAEEEAAVCKKTVRLVLLELMGMVEEKIQKELVGYCQIHVCIYHINHCISYIFKLFPHL